MENNNEHLFKFSVPLANVLALITVIVNVIFERVGTYPNYSSGRYGQTEMIGILIPLMILVIPVFVKKYRQECWNKNILIMTVAVLIISLFLIIVMYLNKNYYHTLWLEAEWTRDNCPPIRWDFWNIADKTA